MDAAATIVDEDDRDADRGQFSIHDELQAIFADEYDHVRNHPLQDLAELIPDFFDA